jgi:hypothetical protein
VALLAGFEAGWMILHRDGGPESSKSCKVSTRFLFKSLVPASTRSTQNTQTTQKQRKAFPLFPLFPQFPQFPQFLRGLRALCLTRFAENSK